MYLPRYNKVRVMDRQTEPVFSCQNELTLKGYLKERLNFSGFVITDCERVMLLDVPRCPFELTFQASLLQGARRTRPRCGKGSTGARQARTSPSPR